MQRIIVLLIVLLPVAAGCQCAELYPFAQSVKINAEKVNEDYLKHVSAKENAAVTPVKPYSTNPDTNKMMADERRGLVEDVRRVLNKPLPK
jgi:hypothetical protein